MVDGNAAVIAMFDRRMRYLAVSPSWLRVFGLARPDIIGQGHYEVFPDLPARYREVHRRCLEGEECRCELDLFVRADGSSQWARWAVTPWRTEEAEVGGIVLSIEDVTRAKVLESSLGAAERMLKSVFELSSLGIAVTDVDGRFLQCNPAFAALVGYSEPELRDMFVGSVMHPDDAPPMLGSIEAVRQAERGSIECRGRLLRRDGSVTWVHSHVSSIPAEPGGQRRLALFAHDVSERVAAEERCRQADRLASIGMLGAELGHDLGNVLLALRGATSALGSALGPSADQPSVRDSLSVIREGTGVLQDLAEGLYLLAVSTSDDPASSASRSPSTDLRRWWDASGGLVRRAVPKGVAFSFRAPEHPCVARIAPSAVTQVLLNLCANASQAVSGNATDGRAPACVEIVAEPASGGNVQILVRDNGAGMKPEVVRRAFDPFFTTRSGGTGLGLSIVQRLVHASGGSVRIESVPGLGTTVTAVIPSAALAEPGPDLRVPPRSGPRSAAQ